MPNENLQREWAAIWASEARALAVDREVAEAMERGLQLWAVNMAALFNALPHDPSGCASTEPPPGPPAVTAAPSQP